MTAFVRTPLVLPFAAAVTVGLFLGMRALIDIGEVEPVEAPEPIEVVLIEHIEEPGPDRTRDPDWVDPIDPPPPPEPLEVERAVSDDLIEPVSFTAPPIDPPDVGSGSGGLVSPERSPSPIVRVEPVYPARMAQRGIEDQCTVLFDIAPDGTTANVRILTCSNTGFERSARTAVARWRYNPQVQEGQPVMFRGATTQLVFRLAA